MQKREIRWSSGPLYIQTSTYPKLPERKKHPLSWTWAAILGVGVGGTRPPLEFV